jgi:hypothetical protein
MIDPGSIGDWLQASLMAGALGGLAAPAGVHRHHDPHHGRAHARRIRSLTRTQRPPGPASVQPFRQKARSRRRTSPTCPSHLGKLGQS